MCMVLWSWIVPVYALKSHGGGGTRRTAPLILNLNTRWMWTVSFRTRPLSGRERTTVPVEKEDEWAPETVWTFRKEKNLYSLPGFEHRTVQPVVYPLYHIAARPTWEHLFEQPAKWEVPKSKTTSKFRQQ